MNLGELNAAAGSPESLHTLHRSELHAVELLLPAVVMYLGLDEGVWVRHGECHNVLVSLLYLCIVVVRSQVTSAVSVWRCFGSQECPALAPSPGQPGPEERKQAEHLVIVVIK